MAHPVHALSDPPTTLKRVSSMKSASDFTEKETGASATATTAGTPDTVV